MRNRGKRLKSPRAATQRANTASIHKNQSSLSELIANTSIQRQISYSTPDSFSNRSTTTTTVKRGLRQTNDLATRRNLTDRSTSAASTFHYREFSQMASPKKTVLVPLEKETTKAAEAQTVFPPTPFLPTHFQQKRSMTILTPSHEQHPASSGITSQPKAVPHPYVDITRDRMLPSHATDYKSLVSNFTMPSPQFYNMGVDITDKHAHRAEETAIIHVDEAKRETKVNFGQLIDKSNQIGNALQAMGVQQGDRVAILMSQSPEAVMIHAAVYKIGAIAVPLFTLFGPEALEYRLQNSQSKAIFIEPSKLEDFITISDKLPDLSHVIVTPALSSVTDSAVTPFKSSIADAQSHLRSHSNKTVSVLPDVLAQSSKQLVPTVTAPDDPALIIYTSGTTGQPKGALHGHRVLLGHLPGVEFPQNLFPQKNDLFYTPADWCWIGGLLDVVLPSLHHGVSVLSCRMKGFDPEFAFKLFEQYQVKNAFLPPTALKMMREVESPHTRFKYNVRSIGSGGETLGESILEWGRKTFGLDINEFYGQTECNLVLGNCSAVHPIRPGSMGIPIPGHDVQIVDDRGNILEPGARGNIAVRAPHPVMFLRYLHNEKATREKYVGSWLMTGDLGRKDEDGYFWYVGRDDDVINTAGYRVGPSEIEECMAKHPSVNNVAVVGSPDEIRNEIVKAFVVLAKDYQHADKDGLTQDLMNHVKNRLAKHEYPRKIEFVSELPMTTTGKIIRRQLKKAEYEKYYRERGMEPPQQM